MQLKKLSDSHYVVVSDEPINKGDWCYAKLSNQVFQNINPNLNSDDKVKITHSTRPLEYVMGHDSKGWVSINPIDLSYIKSLVGEVDVVDKAMEFTKLPFEGAYDNTIYRSGKEIGYITGYNQCLEDNKHKRFSEEDIISAILFGYNKRTLDIEKIVNYGSDECFIKSLTRPKDTWEVYFDENNNLKIK